MIAMGWRPSKQRNHFWIASAVLVSLAALPLSAAAHEEREILGDRYRLTVGFVVEPAYAGQPNGLDLRVIEFVRNAATPSVGTPSATTVDTVPVRGLEKTLKVEVRTEDASVPLDLQPGNRPESYRATFFPTAPGDYTFQITGEIDGQPVDETFGTSPETFPAVQPVTGYQFPVAVPVGESLNARFEEADEDIGRVRTLALVAVGAGLIGLLGGGLAVALSRRPPPTGYIPPTDRSSDQD
ncbi:MAG: hypothetical protein M3Q71_23175 [Chloroflexota bacterium]|nr:hypothetical protein [Chloroflexota bacterium]